VGRLRSILYKKVRSGTFYCRLLQSALLFLARKNTVPYLRHTKINLLSTSSSKAARRGFHVSFQFSFQLSRTLFLVLNGRSKSQRLKFIAP
jgi:hypothetical protein